MIAIALMDELEGRGRRVPDDVSVVGFDDIPIAGHRRIGLTTVRQPAREMGRRAAEMVLAAIEGRRHVAERVELPSELVVRGSSGPAPEAARWTSATARWPRASAAWTRWSGLDLDVPDGKFLALLGPSGCGKTTALRILAGLEEPTSGACSSASATSPDLQPRDRDVAMVFQSYALYPHKSVAENIAYPLRAAEGAEAERDEPRPRWPSMLSIDGAARPPPRQLSGGQRQRVALARAIVREPQAFLMDEPLSNLDAQLRLQMRIEIKRLQRELGVTTLYVTHDQVEAMTMADMVAVMRDGGLQQLATAGRALRPPGQPVRRPLLRLAADERARGEVADGGFRIRRARWRCRDVPPRAGHARLPARARRSSPPAPWAGWPARYTWSSRSATRRSSPSARRRADQPARRRGRHAAGRRALRGAARPRPPPPVRSETELRSALAHAARRSQRQRRPARRACIEEERA